MIVAWICSLLLLVSFHFQFYSKTSSFIWASAIFGYLSFLAYLTYIMGK